MGHPRRIKQYNDMNCPDPIPVDAWNYATNPLPKLSPSPPGLPAWKPMINAVSDMGLWVQAHPQAGLYIGAIAMTGYFALNGGAAVAF